MRQKIQTNGGVMDIAVTMAERNPGAASVIAKLLKDDSATGFMKLLDLDDMNIRGTQIWIGYKDHCGQDIEKFKQALHDRDSEMVSTINKECLHEGFQEKAVTSGASFGR